MWWATAVCPRLETAQYGGELQPELAEGLVEPSSHVLRPISSPNGRGTDRSVRFRRRFVWNYAEGRVSPVDANDALFAASAAARGSSGYISRATLDQIAPEVRHSDPNGFGRQHSWVNFRDAAHATRSEQEVLRTVSRREDDSADDVSEPRVNHRLSSYLLLSTRRSDASASFRRRDRHAIRSSHAEPTNPKTDPRISKDRDSQCGELTCTICLSDISRRARRRTLPCSHVYHSAVCLFSFSWKPAYGYGVPSRGRIRGSDARRIQLGGMLAVPVTMDGHCLTIRMLRLCGVLEWLSRNALL